MTPNEDTRRVLEKAAQEAASRAAAALGSMVGEDLHANARAIIATAGVPPPPDPDDVATVFNVDGVEDCTFLVSFPRGTLGAVREMMAPGTDEASVPDSMIALEVANICSSHFLNAIGDLIEERLLPSPPALAQGPTTPQGYVIDVSFRSRSGVTFGGTFHFRPGPGIIRALQHRVHLTARP